jgi:Fe(3+) dicitrate transport protein
MITTTLQISILPTRAQNGLASVEGQVFDKQGAVVTGASVTLSRRSTSFERVTRTSEAGSFEFNNLIEGAYHLSVRRQGFNVITREVAILAGQNQNLELVLQPASIAEEVVVNGNQFMGTPEETKLIPGSVAVIDQKELERSHVFNFAEALRKVSGVSVREDEGFGNRPHIAIRGVNPTRSTKILLLEDGIPFAYAPYGDNASYYHPPIERFDSIEVLKGSGQIAYGPVTVAGVVNYITPNPPPKPAGHIVLSGGNRDYFNGEVSYGGTWREVGLLASFVRKQGEGARENVRSGINDFSFKAVTGLGTNQGLTLRVSYYDEESRVTYSGLTEDEFRIDARQNPFLNDSFDGNWYGISGTHAIVFNNLLLTTNIYSMHFRRHWWRQSSNSLQRPNDAADPACGGLANLYTTCGNEGRLREYYTYGFDPRFRVNHNLFGARNETNFGVRLHFENQDRRQLNGNTPTSRTGTTVEDNLRKNQAYSAFVQNRFGFGDLTITPGARIERILYDRTNRLGRDGAGVTGRTDVTQFIPGLGVSYNPSQKITLFAGVHRGFAPPRTEDIINNTTGGEIALDPELSWNYEAGFRSLLHPGVSIDAAFFRMDYANQIVPASVAGGLGATLTNGGESLHQGFELTARVDTGTIFRTQQNLYIRSAYTYLPDARFTGRRFSNIPGFSTVAVTGNRLPYAPEHLVNLSVGYSDGRFDAFVEAVGVSKQFGDDLNTVNPTPDGQRGLIPGYTTWNMTANYKIESRRTTLFVSVKNVFDRLYITDRTRGILPGSPRLVNAGFKLTF